MRLYSFNDSKAYKNLSKPTKENFSPPSAGLGHFPTMT